MVTPKGHDPATRCRTNTITPRSQLPDNAPPFTNPPHIPQHPPPPVFGQYNTNKELPIEWYQVLPMPSKTIWTALGL